MTTPSFLKSLIPQTLSACGVPEHWTASQKTWFRGLPLTLTSVLSFTGYFLPLARVSSSERLGQ